MNRCYTLALIFFSFKAYHRRDYYMQGLIKFEPLRSMAIDRYIAGETFEVNEEAIESYIIVEW